MCKLSNVPLLLHYTRPAKCLKIVFKKKEIEKFYGMSQRERGSKCYNYNLCGFGDLATDLVTPFIVDLLQVTGKRQEDGSVLVLKVIIVDPQQESLLSRLLWN